MDYDWGQDFWNNSDQDYWFYLHYYDSGKTSCPAYDQLSTKPYLHLIKSKKCGGWSMWPTTFEFGTLGHMYVFSPDTLDRYSWEEVLAKKKYWFTARPCQLEPIQFPEEFEYMGDM
ncbi:hypothetical protein [Alistipes sp.]|uniref:hypothetical protein n=1 Tax=Alistipes sp. TaxID=1872444 RepID=UPI003AAF2F65